MSEDAASRKITKSVWLQYPSLSTPQPGQIKACVPVQALLEPDADDSASDDEYSVDDIEQRCCCRLWNWVKAVSWLCG